MDKFPSFEEVKKIAVPVRDIRPGLTILESYPHHTTEPLYGDNDEIIRDSNLVVYINNLEAGYYIGYIKGLNFKDFKGDKNFKLVVRKVFPNEHSTRFVGRVYLEEKLEYGDEFLFHARDLAKKDNKLYGRFLSYNVFCFKDIYYRQINLPAFLKVKAKVINENNSIVKVEPLKIISQQEFKEDVNRIFRAGS